MNQACKNCGQEFEISDQDMKYYEKVSPVIAGNTHLVPPPTHCPSCRQQRRFSWRNERSLYHRRCDLTGKTHISCYHPDADVVAYEFSEWWSDKWDARDFGREFDFSRPFFEQWEELMRVTPQQGLNIWNSENCDYCNYVGHDRNCYLIFGAVYSEDCYYGSPYYSKDCVDALVLRECERCYECVDCRQLHTCFYCQDCHSSNDLIYCYDLQGCSECIGCAGLRNKKFCIFNKQYSEEEYRKMKVELDLCIPDVHAKLQSELRKVYLQIPHRYMQSNQVQEVTGNYVYNCKNVRESFYADRSEDCAYCAQVVDLKDCYDNNYTEENELCVEYIGAYQNNRTSFSGFCNLVNDALYCIACHSCHDLFGCISMRNAEYCILNKQYTKEEYEELVPKIIDHMRETGEWGEFFPVNISPYGYNETVAQEYFQMEKEDVKKKDWFWRDEEQNQEQYMGPPAQVPSNIDDVSDDICEQILQCEDTDKLFRVIEREVVFYKDLHLPIPNLSPNARHFRRLAMRNPRRLWDRECAKCKKVIRTSYAPDRPEIVYCDDCFLQAVR